MGLFVAGAVTPVLLDGLKDVLAERRAARRGRSAEVATANEQCRVQLDALRAAYNAPRDADARARIDAAEVALESAMVLLAEPERVRIRELSKIMQVADWMSEQSTSAVQGGTHPDGAGTIRFRCVREARAVLEAARRGEALPDRTDPIVEYVLAEKATRDALDEEYADGPQHDEAIAAWRTRHGLSAQRATT
ncbi:hypothetical protein CXY01_10370 [Cellulomonas xylanilytica]|uniref:Uncharacterized protein n=1 Tax=Cellulomonas xylanilytica TaxID=233583 RepID=A0A510V0U4_9CELL|nr:hypothetical protein CXY01_10370 [Cellulomonas xylanilytica]